MDDKVMKFYAEVRHVGSSSRFRPLGPSTDSAPSHVLALEDVAMWDYNSGKDSDYEEESLCHSTEEDEEVPNTLAGCPQLVILRRSWFLNAAKVYFQLRMAMIKGISIGSISHMP
ncbi:hypothetical protein PIB30_096936, partial [Stylosanthes scabra]|nr:hypothetical protein [Stylosanthes scabra]